MHITAPTWMLPASGARTSAPWRSSPWRWMHNPVWVGRLGAALLGIGLLLAFQLTVAGGVESADQRHKALLAQHNGLWRCNLLRHGDERAACRVRVNEALDPSK